MRRLRRWFRPRVDSDRIERDVDDELSFHLEMRAKKLRASGLDAERAREEALARFGDYAGVRAEVLVVDGWRAERLRVREWFRTMGRDVGYAFRSFRRSPGFTAVVLLSLGLGIGANTAVFTLLDAVLLRPLPVRDPARLVAIGDTRRIGSLSCCSPRVDLFSYPLYMDLRDAVRSVPDLVATGRTDRLDVQVATSDTSADAGMEHPSGRLVSGNYFEVLGAGAAVGRTLVADDDRVANGSPVVVISWDYWRRRLDSDPGVVGRTLIVNGTAYAIVGVAKRGFTGEVVGQRTDLWIPLTMQPSVNRNEPRLEDRAQSWLLLMGRLAPGATIEQASAEFNALTWRLIDAAANGPSGLASRDRVRVSDGRRGLSWIRSVYADPLRTLMGTVVLVLLAVCANIANLLLARGTARRREIGIRLAIGAGPRRVLQQLLTESALLALLGGLFGLLVAWWGSRALVVLAGGGRPLGLDARLDGRVLAFSAAAAATAAVLFGVLPSLRATRLAMAATSRSPGLDSGSADRVGRRGPTRALVAAQVSFSLALLVATSLIVQSTRRLAGQSLGVARDALLMVRVNFAPAGLGREAFFALQREVLERVRALPGVEAATYSENGIFSGTESDTDVAVEGFVARSSDDSIVAYDRVGPGYAGAIGARMLLGRDIDTRDKAGGVPVLVVNEAFARHFFRGESAGGRMVRAEEVERRIVGVVADIRDHGLRGTPDPRVYIPLEQSSEDPPSGVNFEIRTKTDPAVLVRPVHDAIMRADPALRIVDERPLSAMVLASMSQDRLVARVIGFFGLLALGLAVLGLYGVLTYATVRRTGEFGLRLALGASPGDLRRIVLLDAAGLVALGGAAGLPLAFAAALLIRGQLFGVAPFDPDSFVVALALLGTSAALAGWIPASRAARVGPLVALRSD